jgi:hypothetical protein
MTWFTCPRCGHLQSRPAPLAERGACVRCQPDAARPRPEAPDPAAIERDRIARRLLQQAGVIA